MRFGISGIVFDLNPGDPAKAFGIPGVGAVYFPANVVPVGTLVAITNISGLPSPLNTRLDIMEEELDKICAS